MNGNLNYKRSNYDLKLEKWKFAKCVCVCGAKMKWDEIFQQLIMYGWVRNAGAGIFLVALRNWWNQFCDSHQNCLSPTLEKCGRSGLVQAVYEQFQHFHLILVSVPFRSLLFFSFFIAHLLCSSFWELHLLRKKHVGGIFEAIADQSRNHTQYHRNTIFLPPIWKICARSWRSSIFIQKLKIPNGAYLSANYIEAFMYTRYFVAVTIYRRN